MLFRRMLIAVPLLLILSGCIGKKVELELMGTGEAEKTEAVGETHIGEEERPQTLIEPADTVKILVRADGAPGMFLGEDGEVHGFYVDLEQMVMGEMGQDFEFVPYYDVTEVIQGIKAGVYHIALSTPDLPDYKSFLNLSIPYEVLNYVTFVREEDEEILGTDTADILKNLKGKKVGVQSRGHIYQVLRNHKDIILLEYPTTTQALEDLNRGVLDAVPDVKRIGLYYAEKEGWEIKPVGNPIISHDICTSFSKVLDPSLKEKYDGALEKIIADGRLERLYESYFGTMEDAVKPWN